MSKPFPLALLTLALTPATILHAAPPTTVKKPVPPLVQKFIQTMESAQTLSVDAVQVVPPGSIAESAHLIFARPNKMKLTAQTGRSFIGTMVSNGKTFYQWNTRQYSKQDALESVYNYSAPQAMNYTASTTASVFESPARFLILSLMQDKGAVVLHGVPARKVTVAAPAVTITFWIAQSNGLPLQIMMDDSTRSVTIAFKNIQLNKPVATSVFSARPPKNLTAYAPPSRPAEPELLPVGSPAPDFTLPSPTGKSATLSSLKGQVVLIDFWATWCGPCMEAMPHIQALHKELGGKGLKVLSVNTSDTQPAMTKFLKTHKEYTTTMLFDGASPSVSSAKYKVSGIPTVYLIDKDGKIAASFVGYDPDGETAIKAALAKLGVE